MYELNGLLLSAFTFIAALLLVRWIYVWLLPQPMAGIPHNPVLSVWGDIPEITRETKSKTFGEYLADQVRKHGPIFQVSPNRPLRSSV